VRCITAYEAADGLWQLPMVVRSSGPGHEAFGLDQLPEAVLPLIVLRAALNLGWVEIVPATAAFAMLDVLSTRIWHAHPGVA
jgi:hypothetical protein